MIKTAKVPRGVSGAPSEGMVFEAANHGPTTDLRILIIDDNLSIHDDFRRVLRPADYHDDKAELDALEAELFDDPTSCIDHPSFRLDFALQGRQGVDQVAAALQDGQPFALAFIDVRMPPGWDGIDTIERLWSVDPDLQVVLCSAYSDYSWTDVRARLGDTDALVILRKPFDNAEVMQLAHALTRKWSLQRSERRRSEELEVLVDKRTAALQRTTEKLADEIAQREQIEAELRLAQKLESIGQLASGIAHEINTPTQYVADNVQFLRDACAEIERLRQKMRDACDALAEAEQSTNVVDQVRQIEDEIDLDYLRSAMPEAFEATQEGLRRIATIVEAMKEFAHQDRGQKAPVDLNRALLGTLEVCRSEYKYVAEVETRLGDLPLVHCRRSEISQVFLNLIVNAAHAIEASRELAHPKSGLIQIRSEVRHEEVVITVADNGCGVPADVAHRIFDPFFTTKEVGKGTGQGLAIARSVVVDKHGGRLTFETVPGEGTTFCVCLPIGS